MIEQGKMVKVVVRRQYNAEGFLYANYYGKADEQIELTSSSGKTFIIPPQSIIYVEEIDA